MINDILKSYDNAMVYKEFDSDLSINLITEDSVNPEIVNKSLKPLGNLVKFWHKDHQPELPLAVITCNENGYDWLAEQLKSFNFYDAMPSKEKWDYSWGKSVFGSGGHTVIDGKVQMLYWQVVGSTCEYTNTGEIKTPGHLTTHSIQTAVAVANGGQSVYLPGWFVEGQADFASLITLSNGFQDYVRMRKDFFADAYIPDGTRREQMKGWSSLDWEQSLINSPHKFAGIPLHYEYYTGLLAYEKMMELISHDQIMELYRGVTSGKDFNDLFFYHTGITTEKFYKDLSETLSILGKTIKC